MDHSSKLSSEEKQEGGAGSFVVLLKVVGEQSDSKDDIRSAKAREPTSATAPVSYYEATIGDEGTIGSVGVGFVHGDVNWPFEGQHIG